MEINTAIETIKILACKLGTRITTHASIMNPFIMNFGIL